ncbi:CDP-alcohol phosphatidyltransferase family protein [Patescibacteria group bacterium]
MKKKNWLIWNAANIITLTRVAVPFILLFPGVFFWMGDWPIEQRFLWALLLLPTDIVDGLVARWIGNTDGIGKYLDPLMDKIVTFSFIIFFYVNGLVNPILLGLILTIEILTVLTLFFLRMKVNEFGKLKMVLYFIGVMAVYFNLTYGISEMIASLILMSATATAAIALMCYIVGDIRLVDREDSAAA